MIRKNVGLYQKNLKDTIESHKNFSDSEIDKIISDNRFRVLLNPKDAIDKIQPINLMPLGLRKTIDNLADFDMPIESFYELNSSGSRCDEFTDKHDGLHILFSGCSVTVGEGMFKELTWAYKTYKHIAESQKVSGYFNVALPGGTIIESISQAMEYIRRYGNPNVIFLALPDLEREFAAISGADLFAGEDPFSMVDIDFVNLLVYNYYKIFEMYCTTNGIDLYSFCWDDMDYSQQMYNYNFDPRKKFKGFYEFSKQEKELHLYEFDKRNRSLPLSKFNLVALDGSHPGVAEQDFFFNFIYNKYTLDNSSK